MQDLDLGMAVVWQRPECPRHGALAQPTRIADQRRPVDD